MRFGAGAGRIESSRRSCRIEGGSMPPTESVFSGRCAGIFGKPADNRSAVAGARAIFLKISADAVFAWAD